MLQYVSRFHDYHIYEAGASWHALLAKYFDVAGCAMAAPLVSLSFHGLNCCLHMAVTLRMQCFMTSFVRRA